MIRISIGPTAKAEICETARTYDGHRPGLGAQFREELNEVLTQIREMPRGFREVYSPVRRANLKRFPYAVFYLIRESRSIEVLAVTHQKRDPRTIRRRLRD